MRGLSMIYAAGGYQIAGRQNEGLHVLRDAIRQYGPRFDAYSLRLWMSLMLTSQFVGSWDESSDAARHCLEMSRRSGMELGVAWGHYGMGVAAFEKGQSAVAKQHFHAIRELAYSAHLRAVSDSMICSAIVLEMEGELDRAGDVLDELSYLLIDGSSTNIGDELMSCRARLALARGDASGALRLLSSVPPTLPTRPLFQTEVPQVTKARAFLARGGRENLVQARAHAQEVLRFARRTFATRFEIESLVVLALCAEKEGARDEALRFIESAVLVAEPTGSVRIFADKGEAIAPLLRNVGGRGVASAFVETLLAAIPSASRTPASAAAGNQTRMLEPLTNREMDVLELLAQRLSTKEIAEVLVVAPSTVQTHLSNLFQKLEAENRRDAVLKARAVGILA
jgi:LuxR family maltose regulon positive regulatory protein